ncbi:MAG: RNA polymerase sigma-70 factor [Tannerella sp.]|nr:RNA polymerase sigma-70 factor [Tannerella sp.]
MNSEKEIVEGLKAGCDAAYKYIYEHLYKMLCKVAYEYVNDSFVAEMMVSDVIFSLWQNRCSLVIHTSLRHYLVKSVHNRCLNHLAQTERQIDLLQRFGNKMDAEHAHGGEYPDSPLTDLIEKELDTKINACINALPAQTRRIFCLSRFKHLKYDEISTQTGVSVDVVKYHIKTALSRLRAELKDYLLPLLVFLLSF